MYISETDARVLDKKKKKRKRKKWIKQNYISESSYVCAQHNSGILLFATGKKFDRKKKWLEQEKEY